MTWPTDLRMDGGGGNEDDEELSEPDECWGYGGIT